MPSEQPQEERVEPLKPWFYSDSEEGGAMTESTEWPARYFIPPSREHVRFYEADKADALIDHQAAELERARVSLEAADELAFAAEAVLGMPGDMSTRAALERDVAAYRTTKGGRDDG